MVYLPNYVKLTLFPETRLAVYSAVDFVELLSEVSKDPTE